MAPADAAVMPKPIRSSRRRSRNVSPRANNHANGRRLASKPEVSLSKSERLARALTDFTGSTLAFIIAVVCVLAWAVSGPIFGYSESWQLVINTGTTVVTFLMVFLIQRSQNKDSLAIHLKLDELVAAYRGASNRLVSAEDLPEEDLADLRDEYRKLMQAAAREEDPQGAHSIDEQPPGGADPKRRP
jgi:low affinity Fe/Cu permease